MSLASWGRERLFASASRLLSRNNELSQLYNLPTDTGYYCSETIGIFSERERIYA